MPALENFLIIHGCGGHARSVADVAVAAGEKKVVFVDAGARPDETILGFDVIKIFRPEDFPGGRHIVALGDAGRRAGIFLELSRVGMTFSNVIAPDATLGLEACFGRAVFIGRGAHVGPLASIGDNTIINTHALVEHESSVGRNCHVAVNATIAGRCTIGDDVMIGAGATVIDGIRICAGTTVGAGAVVVKDIGTPGTYVGVPAVRIPAD